MLNDIIHIAYMQQEAFNRNAQSQANMQRQSIANLQGIGLLAGMAAYHPPPTPVADQMRYELNQWLKDWDK